jgi:hypothetical protein
VNRPGFSEINPRIGADEMQRGKAATTLPLLHWAEERVDQCLITLARCGASTFHFGVSSFLFGAWPDDRGKFWKFDGILPERRYSPRH